MVKGINIKEGVIEFCKKSKKIPNLIGMVFFGSALEDKLTKKSDIDLVLVFDCQHNPEVSKESEMAHKLANEIEIKYNLSNPFSLVFLNLREKKDVEPSFLFEICNKGLFLTPYPEKVFGKYLKKSLSPYLLIKYSTKNLPEKDKKRLLRYIKNIIDKNSKIGGGVILIKKEKFEKLKELLDSIKAGYRVKEVWV